MDKNRTLEFYVGIFVFLGFAAMLFMALQAANLGSFTGSAAVKSAGVVVGRVQSVVFDPESFQAKVTMDLDAAYPFPADSSAKILTSGLLGEQYVGLEAGADEENLKNGDEIRRTQSAVVLETLISQFLYNTAEKTGKE